MLVASLVLLAAFALDQCIGDPVYALHPVRLIGRLVSLFEAGLRRLRLGNRLGGFFLVLLVSGASLSTYLALRWAAGLIHDFAALLLDVFLLYSCLVLRDLADHARPIGDRLDDGDLAAARTAVQRIVGRDAARLDAPGVARAAVESVAESFVDGLLSPVFWFAVAALVGGPAWLPTCAALLYRCINTLDSMVGYRNERYARFGSASACLDDELNFVPARLGLLPLLAAAAACRLDARRGWRVAMRDRLKHASPNSAHAESFAAGALGVRLGGPTVYPGRTVEKPWLGEEEGDAKPSHIRQCCQLIRCAGWISVVISVSLLAVFDWIR